VQVFHEVFMSNLYNRVQTPGESWVRCFEAVCQNRYGEAPSILFREERAVALTDSTAVVSPLGGTLVTMQNPFATFEILNLETGLPTGTTMTDIELYTLLWSRYGKAAKDRDTQQEALQPVGNP
jgi:hypothetical protein